MGPYLRPEVTGYTHNPLSLTASCQAASHANAAVSISKTRRKNRVTQSPGIPTPEGALSDRLWRHLVADCVTAGSHSWIYAHFLSRPLFLEDLPAN